MPWCPECKAEYREGIEVCSDCNIKLVDEPVGTSDKTDYDHEIFLTSVGDELEAGIVESLLAANNIPVRRKYRDAGAYLNIYMGRSISGIDIYVPSKLYDNAQELIAEEKETGQEENESQLQEENESQPDEEKKLRRSRSIRAWIILLLFIPGIAIAVIYYLIILFYSFFK